MLSFYTVLNRTFDRLFDSNDFEIIINISITLFSAIFWSFLIWYGLTRSISQSIVGIVFIAFMFPIYILFSIRSLDVEDHRRHILILLSILFLSTIINLYILLNFQELNGNFGAFENIEYLMSLLIIMITIFLTNRAFGLTFSAFVIVLLAYGALGKYVPVDSIFWHAGISGQRILEISVLNINGIFGRLTEIVAVLVAPFLLFAGIVQGFRGFEALKKATMIVTERFDSGVSQSAIIMSFILGSLTGSAAGNTSLTGSFTIPMMKESGVKKSTAAAIESVASTGGQILPPVMGSAAFIMADFLGRPLVDILAAALIPALIYYITLAFSVIIITRNTDTKPSDFSPDEEDEYYDVTDTVIHGLQLLIPFFCLIYLLAIARLPALLAAIYTVLILLTISFISEHLRSINQNGFSKQTFMESNMSFIKKLFQGLRKASQTTAPIGVIIAAIGIIIVILLTTGLPTMIALLLVDLSGGILVLLLLFSMTTAILLGMGMPTAPAYILVAIVLAPSIMEAGIPTINTHFFILYFAVFSVITPPIAVGVVIASSIAESNFWRSCFESLKISFPLFILPYSFIYRPSVISTSLGFTSITTGITILFGAIIVLVGVNGFNYSIREINIHKYLLSNIFKLLLIIIGGLLMLGRAPL